MYGNAWETGYRFATDLRNNLNGGKWKSRSLDDLAGRLNIDQEHCILPDAERCPFLDALTGFNQLGNPKFSIEKRRPESRQFAFLPAQYRNI